MNNILRLIMFFLLYSITVCSQKNLTLIPDSQLSKDMIFKGKFITAIKWDDSLGKNYLVLSKSPLLVSESAKANDSNYSISNDAGVIDTIWDIVADNRDREIYAYHYLKGPAGTVLLWKMFDLVYECPFDLTIDYLLKTPLITDLDKNGICETCLIYWLGCRSDVSALNMKLIMHIGKEKYAVRGTRIIRSGPGPNDVDGGDFKFDDNWKSLPKIFNNYALKLWNSHKTEVIE